MKKLIMTVFALSFFMALLSAPWRLAVLGAETLVVPPGQVRISAGTDKYWEVLALQDRLQRFGWTVSYSPTLISAQNAFGMTDYSSRSIVLDTSLSWNERYSVLAHEAGHTLHSFRLTVGQREVFAEAVAMLISRDGVREHARYLASLRPDTVVTLLTEWPAIYRAAAVLGSE